MSALSVAVRRPVSRGVISSSFSAAPRIRTTPLRLPIMRRKIPNQCIGSMRLHTDSSNNVNKHGPDASSNADLDQVRQLVKNMKPRPDNIETCQSENSEEIKDILKIIKEEKELREQKEKDTLQANKAATYLALLICGALGLFIAYDTWKSRVERREYAQSWEEKQKRWKDEEKVREDERKSRENEQRRIDQQSEAIQKYLEENNLTEVLHKYLEENNLSEVRESLKRLGLELRFIVVPEGCV